MNDQKELMEHYQNPQNNTKLENYNGLGIAKNPANFGQVAMYLLIEDGIIKNIGYDFRGCPSIAMSGSLLTTTLKGETLEEGISVANELETRLKFAQDEDECPRMIICSFLAAAQNYKNRQNGLQEDGLSVNI